MFDRVIACTPAFATAAAPSVAPARDLLASVGSAAGDDLVCERCKHVVALGIIFASLIVAAVAFALVASLMGLRAATLLAVTVAFVTMLARHEVSLVAIGSTLMLAVAVLVDNGILIAVGAVLTLAFAVASMVGSWIEH